MTKKTNRAGKAQSGGRVTPKGVQPAGTRTGGGAGRRSAAPTSRFDRHDAASLRPAAQRHAPARAGHHRGQR